MIRTVLIFVYITLVLLVSGLAKADGLAQVQRVELDKSNYMLHVGGAFMNGCQSAPKPVVLKIESNESGPEFGKVVRLGIQTEKLGQFCSQAITGKFDLVFDVRALNLPEQENLVLIFENMAAVSFVPVTVRIDRPARSLQFSSVEVTGQLVEMPTVGFSQEPVVAVVGKDGTVTQVKALVDLSDYLNNEVMVGGIPLGAVVAPELGYVDLGFEDTTGPQPEKVFAMEISLTPSK